MKPVQKYLFHWCLKSQSPGQQHGETFKQDTFSRILLLLSHSPSHFSISTPFISWLLRLSRNQCAFSTFLAPATVSFLPNIIQFSGDDKTITYHAGCDSGPLLSYRWENLGSLHYRVLAFEIQFLPWTSIFTERKVVWEIQKGFSHSFFLVAPPTRPTTRFFFLFFFPGRG